MIGEFFSEKLRLGQMRHATDDELKDRNCDHLWHKCPLAIRAGSCPRCGQRLEGWLYEVK